MKTSEQKPRQNPCLRPPFLSLPCKNQKHRNNQQTTTMNSSSTSSCKNDDNNNEDANEELMPTFLQSLKSTLARTTDDGSSIQRGRPIQGRVENKIEREIIKAITSGDPQSLKPNSGEAIPIGDSYICVSFHEESESDCRVWEWHGHVVSYSEEGGFKQEYVYGNYFERKRKVLGDDGSDDHEEEGEERGFGLRSFVGGLSFMDRTVFCGNFGRS